MTYAKAIPAASEALCGRAGSQLIRAYFQNRRGRHRWIIAWLFLGPSALKQRKLVERIADLHPAIGLVIRDYDKTGASRLLSAAKMQRRPCLLAPKMQLGTGQHTPRWKRPERRITGMTSMSIHTYAEAIRAKRAQADLAFVSPVFTTSSHPGAAALGEFQARRLARRVGCPVYALGGINDTNVKRIGPGFAGFAAITALLTAV